MSDPKITAGRPKDSRNNSEAAVKPAKENAKPMAFGDEGGVTLNSYDVGSSDGSDDLKRKKRDESPQFSLPLKLDWDNKLGEDDISMFQGTKTQGMTQKALDENFPRFQTNPSAASAVSRGDDAFRFKSPRPTSPIPPPRRYSLHNHSVITEDTGDDRIYFINEGKEAKSGVLKKQNEMPWQAELAVQQKQAGKGGRPPCGCR